MAEIESSISGSKSNHLNQPVSRHRSSRTVTWKQLTEIESSFQMRGMRSVLKGQPGCSIWSRQLETLMSVLTSGAAHAEFGVDARHLKLRKSRTDSLRRAGSVFAQVGGKMISVLA